MPEHSLPHQGTLWDGLSVDAGWFHMLRGMILDGTAGDMGGTAFLVYNVLKCHANLDSGLSFPSQERIAELVKVTTVTVAAATSKLVGMGLVEEFKMGRSKRYRLIEKLPLKSKEGDVLATADSTYVPKQFKQMLDDVKAYCASGLAPGKQVTINIVLMTGQYATAKFNEITVNSPELAEALAKRLRLVNS